MAIINNQKVLFCNIGWMRKYQGQPDDHSLYGGSWPNKHEVLNFKNINGNYYGYVQPPKAGSIHIEKLGASKNAEKLKDVLVVWTAVNESLENPKISYNVIVGWYKHATVHRYAQKQKDEKRTHNGKNLRYFIETKAINGKLISPEERIFQVKRRIRGWMGQSNVWYANNSKNKYFVKEVLSYIYNKKLPKRFKISKNPKDRILSKEEELQREFKEDTLTREEIIEELNTLKPKSREKIRYNGKKYSRNLYVSERIKQIRGYKCQICNKYITKKNGGRYVEAAHINPVAKGGFDLPSNILILCPNHHKEFDYGDLEIMKYTRSNVIFKLNKKRYNLNLKLRM